MKKAITIFSFILCIFLNGCVDFNTGKRPTDYENTRWVSENPDVYFEVSDDFNDITGTNTYGKIKLENETCEIVVYFDYGRSMVIKNLNDNNVLFRGIYDLKDDKLTIEVNYFCKEIFEKSMNEVIFVKETVI